MIRKDFIKVLCEEEIAQAEVALSIDGISTELQGMIEKLTKMKTDTLATLVKKIKYNNQIEKAESVEQSIGQKLDQAINSLTEVKGSMDNDIVNMFNGNSMSEPEDNGLGNMEDDLSSEEPSDDLGDLNDLDDLSGEESEETSDDEVSDEDIENEIKELNREMK